MAHGLNANLVHKWRRLAVKSQAPTPSSALEFVALPLAAHAQTPATAANDIAIELRRGAVTQGDLADGRRCILCSVGSRGTAVSRA